MELQEIPVTRRELGNLLRKGDRWLTEAIEIVKPHVKSELSEQEKLQLRRRISCIRANFEQFRARLKRVKITMQNVLACDFFDKKITIPSNLLSREEQDESELVTQTQNPGTSHDEQIGRPELGFSEKGEMQFQEIPVTRREIGNLLMKEAVWLNDAIAILIPHLKDVLTEEEQTLLSNHVRTMRANFEHHRSRQPASKLLVDKVLESDYFDAMITVPSQLLKLVRDNDDSANDKVVVQGTTQRIGSGRPKKPFAEKGRSAKFKELATVSEEQTEESMLLIQATARTLKKRGLTTIAEILKETTESPERPEKMKRRMQLGIAAEGEHSFTTEEALGLMLQLGLTVRKYNILRSSCRAKGYKSIFPPYHQLQRAKQDSGPSPPVCIQASETSVSETEVVMSIHTSCSKKSNIYSCAGGSSNHNTTDSDEKWRSKLTDDEFRVARGRGTEAPFTGKFYNHKGDGVYTCVCCETQLFSSNTKYDSGSGWPSFYDALKSVEADGTEVATVARRIDTSHNRERVEIACKNCDAHLGHVFEDGPQPTGERYCINSLSLKFQPKK